MGRKYWKKDGAFLRRKESKEINLKGAYVKDNEKVLKKCNEDIVGPFKNI